MAIGDGANDLPMLMAHETGGIALNAKPKVCALSPHSITLKDGVLALVFLLDPFNACGLYNRTSI